jgi:hypothetical protein
MATGDQKGSFLIHYSLVLPQELFDLRLQFSKEQQAQAETPQASKPKAKKAESPQDEEKVADLYR